MITALAKTPSHKIDIRIGDTVRIAGGKTVYTVIETMLVSPFPKSALLRERGSNRLITRSTECLEHC